MPAAAMYIVREQGCSYREISGTAARGGRGKMGSNVKNVD
jgi:hypothetical protein